MFPAAIRRWVPAPATALELGYYIFLTLIFSFFLSDRMMAGWDTIGHRQLVAEYMLLVSDFSALGFGQSWFNGFPVGYFYPPLFHFFVAILAHLLGSLDLAFNLAILTVILFFSRMYMLLATALIPGDRMMRAICALIGLSAYLLYPGEGIQGAGLVGVINGTIVSTLGHGMILYNLYRLERYLAHRSTLNLVHCILGTALMLYTHYLSSFFYFGALVIYALVYRKRLSLRNTAALFLVPLLIALPIVYLLLHYGGWNSSSARHSIYPPLLSLLGADFFGRVVEEGGGLKIALLLMVKELKVLQLFVVLMIVYSGRVVFFSKRKPRRLVLYFVISLCLLLLATDHSFVYLLRDLPVHWYRAFDLAFITATICIALLIPWLLRSRPLRSQKLAAAAMLFFFLIRLVTWSPYASDGYRSPYFWNADPALDEESRELIAFLKEEPDQLILPELIFGKDFYGSPHALDVHIQTAGQRNLLGLMVESSTTSRLTFAYMHDGLEHTFRWGVDLDFGPSMFEAIGHRTGNGDQLLRFLAEMGVDRIVGRTPAFRAFARRHTASLPVVHESDRFLVLDNPAARAEAVQLSSYPIAYIDWERLEESGLPGKEDVSSFLAASNQFRLVSGTSLPVVDATRLVQEEEVHAIQNGFAAFFVVSPPGREPVPSYRVRHFIETGLPVFLSGFAPGGQLVRQNVHHISSERNWIHSVPDSHAEVELQLETESALRRVSGVRLPGNGNCAPILVRRSFFPDWESTEGTPLLMTDLGHTYVCAGGERVEMIFRNPLGRLIAFVLVMLVLVVPGLSLVGVMARRVPRGRVRK